MVDVRQFLRADGSCPFAEWFDSLDAVTSAKIATTVTRMELGNFGDSKSLGEGLWERRLHFGPGYRLYFGKDGQQLVILLVGGTNRRQDADIMTARKHWVDYRRRKKSN